MEKKQGGDVQMEATEGGVRELVLRWFTETQETFILHSGNFPDWFRGFTARKDAEEQLRDKDLGCFLVRLSDKAIGYILSYRGLDRCRHFVITQNQEGHFVLSGDCQTHQSLQQLIEHHMVSPIQPFGEYLTSSCSQERTADLYDVVSYSPGQAMENTQAVHTVWDQTHSHHQRARLQIHPAAAPPPPPALPPKSSSRKLTGTVSVDAVSLSQSVPPVPRRNTPLGFSLSGSLPDATPHYSNTNRPEQPQRNTTLQPTARRDSAHSTDTDTPAGGAHSEENRSRAQQPPLQLDDNGMEEEYWHRIRSSSSSPTPMKRFTCHTYSLHDPEPQRSWTSRAQQLVQDLGILRSNPLYQPSNGLGGNSAPQGDATYAEVPERPTPTGLSDDTYEAVPREPADTAQGNMYESLDTTKTKKSKSSRGKNNLTWKKFLPEYKKK